jgi:hypothetical protein
MLGLLVWVSGTIRILRTCIHTYIYTYIHTYIHTYMYINGIVNLDCHPKLSLLWSSSSSSSSSSTVTTTTNYSSSMKYVKLSFFSELLLVFHTFLELATWSRIQPIVLLPYVWNPRASELKKAVGKHARNSANLFMLTTLAEQHSVLCLAWEEILP